MAEYIFDAQSNYGWGLSLNMTGKAPAVAKRIFATYADALDYVNNVDDSAIPGLQLSVINDTDDTKNGIYFVSKIGTKAADGSRANDGVLVKDSGSGAISVGTYAEALAKIKVDATTQEVKNLGQIIYVKTATGTVGDEDYKAAGAYVVTGAASLEKLGTTSASGDFSTDIANLRTDLGNLSTTVDGIDAAVDNINDVKIPEVEKAIEDLDGVVIKNVMQTMGGPVLTPDKDGTIVFTWETDITKSTLVPPTTGTVKAALATKVSSIKSGSAEAVAPVDGVATITYDEALNETSTNAPQTKTVHNSITDLGRRIDTAAKNASVSVVSRAITAEDGTELQSILKRYTIYQGEEQTTENVVGTIDIPKDLVVTGGKIVIGDGNNGTTLGEKYLELTIGNQDVPVYIAVKDLVDVYTSGNYITVGDDNTISVNISEVDSKLAEDESAVGGRIKAVEDNIATLYTENFTKDGTIVKIISDATTKLIEGTATGVTNHALSELKTVAEAAYTPGGTKIAREDLDDSTKASLTLADSAIQEIKSGNENQLTVAEDENDSTIITLTPVTVSSDELVKIGTKDEVAGSPEKLLTASVAKEYIDSLWEWAMLD